ncbi:MAG: 2-oxoacid:acceptor oxidoreductase family protein [Deltaproteobacteria bacterium]|nr:2-oxoacid:acceptor oxidoreductase family protein [Deltaproteobacteria bacterium]
MPGITQIRLGGFGGQGIVLAGLLLGRAAVIDGRWASGANSYGAQARGSACRAEVVLSDRPVDFPHVLEADVLVAMSQEAYDRFAGEVKGDGLVIFESHLVRPARSAPVHRGLAAVEAAVRELGNKQVANVVMLGALTALTGVVSRVAMESAISNHVPERFRQINLQALRRGFELGEVPGRVGKSSRIVEGRIQRPLIDETKCSKCKVCGLLCPDLCITGGRVSGRIVIDYDCCKGCGICAAVCPKGAISMVLES